MIRCPQTSSRADSWCNAGRPRCTSSPARDRPVMCSSGFESAHRFHQRGDVFQFRRRRHAVAEVENIAPTPPHFHQQPGRLAGNGFGCRIDEQGRSQVALQSDRGWKEPAGFGEGKPPVDPQHFRPGGHKVGPVGVSAEREDDRRNPGVRPSVSGPARLRIPETDAMMSFIHLPEAS